MSNTLPVIVEQRITNLTTLVQQAIDRVDTTETNAATSATNAGTSETNAAISATAAAGSATAAATSATAAGTSETNAATSATAAAGSATAAGTSETNAATSATAAATSETNAAASATAAANSETNAGTSETNAATSATAAASSATQAAASESTATAAITTVTTLRDSASVHAVTAATEAANAAANSSGQNMAGINDTILANAVAMCFWDVSKDDNPNWILQTSKLPWETLWGKFPAKGLAILESEGLLLYDITGPSPVAWAVRFDVDGANSTQNLLNRTGNTVVDIQYKGGAFVIAAYNDNNLSGGIRVFDFCLNEGYSYGNSSSTRGLYNGDLTQADSALGFDGDIAYTIPSTKINTITLQDDLTAPFNRLGNRMPRIVAGHGVTAAGDGGVVWTSPDRSVTTVQATLAAGGYAVDQTATGPDGELAFTWTYGSYHSSLIVLDVPPTSDLTGGNLPAGNRNYNWFGEGSNHIMSLSPSVANPQLRGLSYANKDILVAYNTGLTIVTENQINEAEGSVAYITATSAPVTQIGDIEYCGLCTTTAGTISGIELVTNESFDGTFTAWAAGNGDETLVVQNNQIVVTVPSGFGGIYQDITTVAGRRYKMRISSGASSNYNASVRAGRSSSGFRIDNDLNATNSLAPGATEEYTFVASQTSTRLSFYAQTANTDAIMYFDNVIVYEEDDNLVLNGTFEYDNSTDWPVGRGATSAVVDNQLHVTSHATTAGGSAGYAVTTEVGKWYEAKFDIVDIPTGGGQALYHISDAVDVTVGTNITPIQYLNSGSEGTKRISFKAVGTTTYLVLGSQNPTGHTIKFDNISVKPLGNHVENGTFDTDLTGWSVPSGSSSTISHSNGGLQSVRNSEACAEASIVPLVSGETYELTWELKASSNTTNGIVYFNAGSAFASPTTDAYKSLGHKSYIFTAGVDADTLQVNAGGIVGLDFTVDNISLRHIPNILTNGTFDSDATGWSTYTQAAGTLPTVTVTDGIVSVEGNAVNDPSGIGQQFTTTPGKTYKLTAFMSSSPLANNRYLLVGNSIGSASLGNFSNAAFAEGLNEMYFTANASSATVTAAVYTDGQVVNIDYILVEELDNLVSNATFNTTADWTLDDPFTISSWRLNVDGSVTTGGDWAWQDVTVEAGSIYRFRCDIERTGTHSYFALSNGATLAQDIATGADSPDITFIPTGNTVRIAFYADNIEDYRYTVDNVILEKVDDFIINGGFEENTDGWTLGTDWVYDAANKRIGRSGTTYANLQQTQLFGALVEGQLYQLRVEKGGGTVGYYVNATEFANLSNGENSIIFRYEGGNYPFFFSQSADGWLDNISVVPVTDLVTNGSFDSVSTGWITTGTQSSTDCSWEIDEGQLIITRGSGGTSGSPYQTITGLIVGAVYRLDITVDNAASVAANLTASGLGSQVVGDGIGTHSVTWKATGTTGSLNLWADVNETVNISKVSLTRVLSDHTHNENHAVLNTLLADTVELLPVATGAELTSLYVNNSAIPVIEYTSQFASMTSWTVEFWLKREQVSIWDSILSINGPSAAHGAGINHRDMASGFDVLSAANSLVRGPTVGDLAEGNQWHHHVITCDGTSTRFYQDGVLLDTLAQVSDISLPDSNHYYSIGTQIEVSTNSGTPSPVNGRRKYLSLFRLSKTVASDDQIAANYEKEKHWFKENALVTLGGTSSDVISHSYDPKTDKLYVLTPSGETVFDYRTGIRLTFDATKAGSGLILAQDEFLARKESSTNTALTSAAINLRTEALFETKAPIRTMSDSWTKDDGTTPWGEFTGTETIKYLPKGYKPLRVWLDGNMERIGSSNDYTIKWTGYRWAIVWTSAPSNTSYAQVEAEQIC